jgi:D-alanine-D-alanine ligase
MDEECVPDGDPEFRNTDNGTSAEYHVICALRKLGHRVAILTAGNQVEPIVSSLTEHRPDIVFNLSEQFDDERRMDANIAGLLEMMAIPFTGTGSVGLMLCRNKGYCSNILAAGGIDVARHFIVAPGLPARMPRSMKFPLIVKPILEDGSDGISISSIVKTHGELAQRCGMVHRRFRQPAIIEEYIEGRELYVGVIGNGSPKVLAPRELYLPVAGSGGPVIATGKAKWDKTYQKKWNIHCGFAQLDEKLRSSLYNVCYRAYGLMQISDYGRIDVRVTPEGRIKVIEANPNPNLSRKDEMEQAAGKSGISYNDLIQRIVTFAYHRSRA